MNARFPLAVLVLLTAMLIGVGDTFAKSRTIPAVTPTQSVPLPTDLHDYRYCEIIPVFRSGATFHVEVYNTMGSNNCPAASWAKVNANGLKDRYGAVSIKVNGPRYWTMNRIVSGDATAAGKIVDFDGIEMTLRGVIETKIWQGTVGDKFYAPNQVRRTTVFVYLKGTRVYELTAPNGDIYRMQSYAQIAAPDLTLADLQGLSTRLRLPKGWTYRSRVLVEDSELKADGLAYVINDNLYNSYQRMGASKTAR